MDETAVNTSGVEENTVLDEQDDWGDIDLSDISEYTDEAPSQEDPGQEDHKPVQEEPAQEEEPVAEQEEADQLFTLKHLDETRQVNRDEVVALAQKGLDYDRIRQDRDNARAEIERLTALEDFLKELAAPSNMSVEDLMDTTRANILAQREGIDQSIALERVRLDKDRKALEAQRRGLDRQNEADQRQAAEQQRRRESMDRFISDHPGLDAKDIPNEVWEAFAGGKDLADAYAAHEAKTLRETLAEREREIEALKQNQTNKARSTGSQTSAGTQKDELDWIDKDWYNGT